MFLGLSNCIFALIYRHRQLHHFTRPDHYQPGTTSGSQAINSLRVTLPRVPIRNYHPTKGWMVVGNTQPRAQTVYFAEVPQPSVSLSEQDGCSRQIQI